MNMRLLKDNAGVFQFVMTHIAKSGGADGIGGGIQVLQRTDWHLHHRFYVVDGVVKCCKCLKQLIK